MTVDASLVVALTLANEMIGAMGVVARRAACLAAETAKAALCRRSAACRRPCANER